MFHKIISVTLISVLISSNIASAINVPNQAAGANNANLQLNENADVRANLDREGFLSDLWNKAFRVNFRDITANNAGQAMRTWSGKVNFPNKFVLENGFDLKINELELDKLFVKTEDLKSKILLAKTANADIGTVNLKEPVLTLLPDRVQVTTETEILFTTPAQLNNIKTRLGVWLTAQKDADLTSMITTLKRGESNAWRDKRAQVSNDLVRGVSANMKASNYNVDAAVFEGLIADCQREKWVNHRDCTRKVIASDIATKEKSVVTTETQEFSLLPPNTILGGTGVIKLRPENVRMTRDQILGIYSRYGAFVFGNFSTWAVVREEREYLPHNQNPFDNEDYCSIVSSNPQKEWECRRLLWLKNDAHTQPYHQNLLNGFTLGESDNYHWSDSIYLHYFFGKKKLASASIDFNYSYGFGIRIPIQTDININKSIVDDWENNARYNISTRVNTLDAGPLYYSGVGLSPDKIFNGNEFIFELGASLDISVWVIGDIIDIDEHIPLVSILASIIKARGESLFGISGNALDSVIANNGFSKSRNFTPPFAGANKVMVFSGQVDVPVYEIPSLLKLVVSLITEVNLDGEIKADMTQVHSDSCKVRGTNTDCPRTITFNTGAFKEYTARAVFDPAHYTEDPLGQYSNFGVELSNFKYIPEIIFDIFVKWTASIKLPVLGWESYSTPKIKVYTFTISSDDVALEAHAWTVDVARATGNQVYATNPVIDIEAPIIELGGDNDRATFSIPNNKSGMIKMYYTINGARPNCQNTWELYDGGRTLIWKNPNNDIVNNKDFSIKTIACSIYGGNPLSSSRSTRLRNDSFKFDINPKWVGGRDRHDAYPVIKSHERITFINPYLDSLDFRYSIDGTNPTCVSGLAYSGGYLNLMNISRDTLENDFSVTIKALACNKRWQTLGQVLSMGYSVHNTYYNPRIDNGDRLHVTFNSYPRQGYETYKSITLAGWDPNCEAVQGVNNLWNNDGMVLSPNTRVKAIICIKLISTQAIVYRSDIESRETTGDRLAQGIVDSRIRDEMRGMMEHRLAEWFLGWIEWLQDDFGQGIDEGRFGMEAVRWIVWLLDQGDISQQWLIEAGWLYRDLQSNAIDRTGFEAWMRWLMQRDELSARGVRSMGTMITSGIMKNKDIMEIAGTLKTRFDSANMIPNSGMRNNFVRNMPRNENAPVNNGYQNMNYIMVEWSGQTNTGSNASPFGQKVKFNVDFEAFPTTSKDEYVNGKLAEAQDNFRLFYEENIKAIDIAIESLTKEKLTVDKALQSNYDKALAKLQEMKTLFINRYSPLLNYSK